MISDHRTLILNMSFCLLLSLSVLLPVSSIAETLLVPSQFDSIQKAIESAVDGDLIRVDAGTFTGPGFRGISYLGKAITVQGAGIDQTVIDCQQMDRGFDFQYGEGSESRVSNLTIVNGLDGCGT